MSISRVITLDQLHRVAPAAFASSPAATVGRNYNLFPTADIVRRMEGEGWAVVRAQQQRSILAERRGVAKHMIRFAKRDQLMRSVGDVTPEVVLTNSHDGLSSYRIMSGLYRLVCSNGMVVASGVATEHILRHTASLEEVIEATSEVFANSEKAVKSSIAFSHMDLTDDERVRFAQKALELRYGTDKAKVPVGPHAVLRQQRPQDSGTDLWTTFNVVQENLLKGGVVDHTRPRFRRTEEGALVHVSRTVRAVRSIDVDVVLNKGLWELAEQALNGTMN
jgi:hypothetical protein